VIEIDIRPVWRFRAGDAEREFDFALVTLLAGIEGTGKLTQAAEGANMSYRHAWNLVADWEAFFGAPLVSKAKGRGTSLTRLGQRLLRAGQRAQSRLAPELDNLAGDFARQLNETLTETVPSLIILASHDYAVAALRGLSAASVAGLDLQYRGSFDALAALRRGECDVAGFHVPEGPLGDLMRRRYREFLPPSQFLLITLVMRNQGFIVKRGNPRGIHGVADLARRDVRLVNRQRGSGTRALLEYLISAAGLERDAIRGYETEETTHGAVAALVAGHQADAGFGVQAAAEEYGLDFVPVCRERYYLACRAGDIDSAPVAALRRLLQGSAFRGWVAGLPGYSATDAGIVREDLEAAPATLA
jgi:putative molybdopterin biosynthesis protein